MMHPPPHLPRPPVRCAPPVTQATHTLKELLKCAEDAVEGLTTHHRDALDQPPDTAAAHYTLVRATGSNCRHAALLLLLLTVG